MIDSEFEECEDPEIDFEEIVGNIELEWKKGKKRRSPAVIKDLMALTAIKRNEWIMEENPLISQVLSKYPVLKDTKIVSTSK